jgi:hypothetical protein
MPCIVSCCAGCKVACRIQAAVNMTFPFTKHPAKQQTLMGCQRMKGNIWSDLCMSTELIWGSGSYVCTA